MKHVNVNCENSKCLKGAVYTSVTKCDEIVIAIDTTATTKKAK